MTIIISQTTSSSPLTLHLNAFINYGHKNYIFVKFPTNFFKNQSLYRNISGVFAVSENVVSVIAVSLNSISIKR